MKKTKISVLGTGYVGLSTALGFAMKGYDVITLTHEPEKVAKINNGIPPFYELGLAENLNRAIEENHLKCAITNVSAILDTDLTFMATGTPSQPDGSIDLQYLKKSAIEIGQALKEKNSYHLLVVKSTVIPGTTEGVIKPIVEKTAEKCCGEDFGLCMNPEFLKQGAAIHDTLEPDRIVIGEHDKKSGQGLEKIYKEFFNPHVPPIVRTTLASAELIKYASNSLLATKISFINIIANLCENIPGADVRTVAHAMGLDKRIGPLFLNAGIGYGGSCFPKDVKALIAYARSLNCDTQLLESVEAVNKAQPLRAIQVCREQLGTLKGQKIAILGLAFKPGTDDMREARVIPIIDQLLKEGAMVTAYDPVSVSIAQNIFDDRIKYANSIVECLKDADCCILATEWDEFKKLEPRDFTKNMKKQVLIDGRRIYDPQKFSQSMRFFAVGLGNKK
jgi:UDPglucose 6-dehydrogenase